VIGDAPVTGGGKQFLGVNGPQGAAVPKPQVVDAAVLFGYSGKTMS